MYYILVRLFLKRVINRTETGRDRQRQAETGRDRQRQAETGRVLFRVIHNKQHFFKAGFNHISRLKIFIIFIYYV